MRNRIIVFGLLIILVVGTGGLFAQMGTGRVSGTVKDTDGNPVEGAKIVAVMQGSDFSLDVESDSDGRWAIIGFRKGQYQFTVTAPRHAPQQFTTSVSGMGKNPSVNVTLEKLSAGQAFATGPAAEKLKEANALSEAKDYDAALVIYNELIAEFPDLYQIRLNIGNCYRDTGRPAEAMAEYEMVLAEEPTNTGALVNVGDMMVRQGDLEGAVSYFERAIDNAPEDEVLPFNVAEIYFDQGNVEKAIEYYTRSTEVKPDWQESWLKLGYAHLNMADMENAAVAFQKCIDIAPDTPQAQQAEAALGSIQ
jgi:tetratricopeptide (TPR) repeat protein